MAANPTLFDELQRQFENNWWGVAVLALAAALLFASKIADALKNLAEKIRPSSADLLIQALRMGPLPHFRDVAISAQDSVYPVGAQIEFGLRHNGRDTGEIRVDSIEVKLDDYTKDAMCPFTLAGDKVFGAGRSPVNVYNVLVSGSGVSSVLYKDPDGKSHKGRTGDILALDPPLKLTLHKSETDSVESIQLLVQAPDPGLYRLSLSLRYSTPKGEGEKKVTSFSICTP